MLALQPQAFAIYQLGTCQHCSKDIERRRLIGWLHVEAFFMCVGQKKPPYTDAAP